VPGENPDSAPAQRESSCSVSPRSAAPDAALLTCALAALLGLRRRGR
jgi:MYXO-CTERM domain-containing protein